MAATVTASATVKYQSNQDFPLIVNFNISFTHTHRMGENAKKPHNEKGKKSFESVERIRITGFEFIFN